MLGKGSDLTGPVNAAISTLKEDGTLAEIYERHLGVAPDEGTSTVTVLPLPSTE
jgi:polar amino acid transport system substrate-binding protein